MGLDSKERDLRYIREKLTVRLINATKAREDEEYAAWSDMREYYDGYYEGMANGVYLALDLMGWADESKK